MNRGGDMRVDQHDFDTREFSWLWLLALATYGVGDVITTIAVIRYAPHVHEWNLVVRIVFAAAGEWGLAGLKLFAFLTCLAISIHAARRRDLVLYYLPPSMLAVVGGFVTVHNLRLLLA